MHIISLSFKIPGDFSRNFLANGLNFQAGFMALGSSANLLAYTHIFPRIRKSLKNETPIVLVYQLRGHPKFLYDPSNALINN